MDMDIPYVRIRDFESQSLKNILDKERNRDGNIFGNFVGEAEAYKPTRTDPSNGDSYSKSVELILESIGFAKYRENFKAHDIGVNTLVHMDEDDLTEIGITDFMDQALFQKQMRDFRSGRARTARNVYKIEEDLIMAQSIYTHLEDINIHLNLVHHYLQKNEHEDYFVSPRKSILGVFNIVMNRALGQAKRMANVLFTGSFDSDDLIPAYLRADGLELPEFMAAKLYKPDKCFKLKPRKNKEVARALTTLAILSMGFTVMVTLIFKHYDK